MYLEGSSHGSHFCTATLLDIEVPLELPAKFVTTDATSLSTFCTVEAIECHLKPDSILTLSAIDYLRPEGFPQFRCQLYNLVL